MRIIILVICFLFVISCTETSNIDNNLTGYDYSLKIDQNKSVVHEYINLTNNYYDFYVCLDYIGHLVDYSNVQVEGELVYNDTLLYKLEFYNDGRQDSTCFDLIPNNNVFSGRIICSNLDSLTVNKCKLIITARGEAGGELFRSSMNKDIIIKQNNSIPLISGGSNFLVIDSLLSGFKEITSIIDIVDPDYNPYDGFEELRLDLVLADSSVTDSMAFSNYSKNIRYEDLESGLIGKVNCFVKLDSSFTAGISTGNYNLYFRAYDLANAESNIIQKKNIFIENKEPLLFNPVYEDTVYVTSSNKRGKISISLNDEQGLSDVSKVSAIFKREGVAPLPPLELFDNGEVEDEVANDGIFTRGLTYPVLDDTETERVYTIIFNGEDKAGNASLNVSVKMVIKKEGKK